MRRTGFSKCVTWTLTMFRVLSTLALTDRRIVFKFGMVELAAKNEFFRFWGFCEPVFLYVEYNKHLCKTPLVQFFSIASVVFQPNESLFNSMF